MTLLIYFAVLEVITLIKPMSNAEMGLFTIIGFVCWVGHLLYWSDNSETGGKK